LQTGTALHLTDKEPRLFQLSNWSRTTNVGGSHLALGPQNIHLYCAWFSTFTAVYGDKGCCGDKWFATRKLQRHAYTKLSKIP
jgi:hypothetical protein